MKKKRLTINLIASMIAFLVQMGINFFLTPILVNKLGNEAYGFIGLANNFVSYATILTVALNSMASRFISIEIHKENEKKANQYYSSVFIADAIMSFLVFIMTIIIIMNINVIINVPEYLSTDVIITFLLVFVNFIITLMGTVFNIATFVKNRIDITSIIQIIGNIMKLMILIILFTLFKPKIYYISIAALIYTIWTCIANIYESKKIAPELKIRKAMFNFKSIKTLISSGIWNSINSLSRVLLTGLDLLIANIFVGANEMGILSIAKTIPSAIESFLATIGNVFAPQFTILYSKNKIKELVEETNFSIKLLSLIMLVPLAGFIVFGTEFYILWLNDKSYEEIIKIQILSILTLAPYLLSAFIFTLSYLDTVTNQLKRPVIVTLIMSIISTITALVLLKVTNLGIYAIAGTSSVFWCIKMLIFTPINAAYNLKIRLTTFYKPFFRAIICLMIVIILFSFINNIVFINTWKELIITAMILGILGYIFSYFLLLNRKERTKINRLIYEKISNKITNKYRKLIKRIICIVCLVSVILTSVILINNHNEINKYIELKNNIKATNDMKYIHFSLDDTINIFEDLTNNKNRYDSIFKNDTLNYLKKMHDIYGVKVTLYCFLEETGKFKMDDCTNKFQSDFKNNKDWLKLGFHSKNGDTNYSENNTFKDIKEDYTRMIKAIINITGSEECIDKIVRLQNYAGTFENIMNITQNSVENGIVGLLSADDERENYYLSKEENNILNEQEIFYNNNITFIRTDIRLENENDIEKAFFQNYGENEIIIFTHEWLMNKNNIKKKLEKCLQLGLENGYCFDFPRNW